MTYARSSDIMNIPLRLGKLISKNINNIVFCFSYLDHNYNTAMKYKYKPL